MVDLANAHVMALKRLINCTNKDNFEVSNIKTGKGSSVLEVIHTFEDVSNIKLNYKIVGCREGDVVSTYADTNKANTVLGWKSKLSLKDALLSAWKWENK